MSITPSIWLNLIKMKQTEIEKLKTDMKPFNASYVAKEAGVSAVTLYNFLRGKHTLTLPNFLRVRDALDKIARDILGIN